MKMPQAFRQYAQDEPFLCAFREMFGDLPGAERPLLATFQIFGLPLPDRDHFVKGSGCLLVFLNNYGLVIRVDRLNNGAPPPDHPRLLRPLWALNEYGLRMEVLPGIRPGAETKIAQWVSQMLENSGVIFCDVKSENVGFLPPENGWIYAVVLDRGAITSVSEVWGRHVRVRPGINDVAQLRYVGKDDTQARIFKPLYDMAMANLPKAGQGWKRAMDRTRPERINDFLNFCAGEIAKYERGELSLLQNNWSGSATQITPIEKGLLGENTGQLYQKIHGPFAIS